MSECSLAMLVWHQVLMIPVNPSASGELASARLGVLGGSGLYNMQALESPEEIQLNTPFGETSDRLMLGKMAGMEVVFLARHGRNHTYLPGEVPYKANLWAMRKLGVKWIISASAVGSLDEEIRPLDMVIPDQFIDRTCQRPVSFFGNGAVAHVSMADPFCNTLSELLSGVAGSLMPAERRLHTQGTYLCMEGPAFSTRAESNLYRQWNCSIIGMTNHTEARLAREAEIAYSTLAMVTDYDCWRQGHDDVTVEMIVENLHLNAELANIIIEQAAKAISTSRPSSIAHHALRDALLTQKQHIPSQTRDQLELFTAAYWV